tara:strand:- start:351 stop:1502 length:1152 start_codon:yes stop_codon:yes gene_type:complete
MTEIKPQSTPQEDELRLIDLLKLIARKKVLFLTVTFFFTLFSIFYAQSITPDYRATVGLLDHNEKFSSLSILEQLDPKIADEIENSTTKPSSIFERFLINIKSYKFKQGIFVNGGFQKKFSHETGVDTDQPISEIYSSIRIAKGDGATYLLLEGSKPKVMVEFLTALVEEAKENVKKEINEIQRSTVKTRINNLSAQIEELQLNFTLQKQKEKIKKQVDKENAAREKQEKRVRLSKALTIAKNLGIKNNNFALAKLVDKKENSQEFPLWFLYGELALQQEIMSLSSTEEIISNTKNLLKETEISNTKNLAIEKLKLKRSQTADLPLLKFKVVTISKHSYSLVKPYQPWVIVGFGLAFGLFISIFMAYLMDKPLKSKETPSAST